MVTDVSQLDQPISSEVRSTVESAAAEAPPIRFPLVRLLRPKQWVKNGFVLAPLIFGAKFRDMDAVWLAVLATVLFSAASSMTYVLNDIMDIERDRAHPLKRHKRPLAAGVLSVRTAIGAMVALGLIVAGGFVFLPGATAVICIYLVVNVAYSTRLKHVPVVDIFTLASGFILRILAGGVAIGVPISPYMLITTLCLALYLGATKRRQELLTHGGGGRAVLQKYSVELLTHFADVSSMGAIVFYGMFTVTVRPPLAYTIPLVIFGFFRYRYIVDQKGSGESPTDVLWHDVPIAVTVLAWVAAAVWVLWHG